MTQVVVAIMSLELPIALDLDDPDLTLGYDGFVSLDR